MNNLLIKNYIRFTVLFLFVLAIMGFFVYPQVDDYEYALESIEKGFWNSFIFEYITWNGRYIATAILSFNPLTWGWFDAYHIIPFLILVLHFLGLTFSFRIFFPEFSKKKVYQLVIIAMGLYWMRHFALAQDLYWMSGSITHSIPNLLALVSHALIYRIYYQKFSWRDYSFVLFLTFLIIGFNETIMLGYSFSLFCAFLYNYLKTKKISKSMVAILVVGAICSLVVILCPGNAVRAGGFEKSHRVFYSISNTITYTIIYSIKFLSPSFLVLFFLFRKNIKEALLKFSITKVNNFNFYFVMFVVLGGLFVSFFPSLWGMGRRPQDRTLNMVMFNYQLLFPIFAWHIYRRFHSKLSWLTRGFEKIPSKLIPIIFIASLCCYNVFDLITESHKLPHYVNIMQDRYKKVEMLQKGEISQAEIRITQESERPYFLVFKDLFGNYKNTFEKYHGVEGKVTYNE